MGIALGLLLRLVLGFVLGVVLGIGLGIALCPGLGFAPRVVLGIVLGVVPGGRLILGFVLGFVLDNLRQWVLFWGLRFGWESLGSCFWAWAGIGFCVGCCACRLKALGFVLGLA